MPKSNSDQNTGNLKYVAVFLILGYEFITGNQPLSSTDRTQKFPTAQNVASQNLDLKPATVSYVSRGILLYED